MMNKLFRKKLTRGGFTLAELLIVVAIIAILVAVAIPVFTSSVKEARVQTFKTGVRAVRAAAINAILNDPGTGSKTGLLESGSTKGWFATAKVSNTGEVTDLHVEAYPSDSSAPSLAEGVGGPSLAQTKDKTYYGSGITKPESATFNPSEGYVVQVLIKELKNSTT